MSERDTIRCPHCELPQFVTISGFCRRCNLPLVQSFCPPPKDNIDSSDQPKEEVLVLKLVHTGKRKHRIELADAFKYNIKRARQKRGWSQDRLADVMGVQRPFISRMETGSSHPALDTVQNFADAFGIPSFGLLIAHPDFEELSLAIPDRNSTLERNKIS